MFAQEQQNFGSLRSIRKSLTQLAHTAIQPVKLLKNPKDALDWKKQFKAGKAMGRAAENVMVRINPLNSTLKKFDEKGIKAGGIGKLLGRTGEKARQNPIATTAIVYAAVLAVGKFGAKAVLSKAYSAYKVGAAGAAIAAAGKGGSEEEEYAPDLPEGYIAPAITETGLTAQQPEGEEATVMEKITALGGPALLLLLL